MAGKLARLMAAVALITAVASTGLVARPASAEPSAMAPLAEFGVQQTGKHTPTAAEVAGSAPLPGANPYLSTQPGATPDYHYWNALLAQRGERAERASEAEARLAAPVPTVDEREPRALLGLNDTLATAQPVPEVGTGDGEQAEVRILGTLAEVPGSQPQPVGPFAEDDGSIPLANPLGLSPETASVRVSAQIGDGPHGSAGTGTGDFDFYAVSGAVAGQELSVDVDAVAIGSTLDSLVAVTTAEGAIVAANDDADLQDSFLEFTIPADGDYLVALTAFGALPQNPFDSASGTGATSEGPYEITVGLDAPQDVDAYAVDLEAGDVVSASVAGSGQLLSLFDPSGRQVIGSTQDLSGAYPEDTRLLGGGNAVIDHIANVSGRHVLTVDVGAGDYETRLRLLRPPLEDATGERQVLFIDFDGAEINAVPVGGTGVRTLSPLAAFLGGWRLGAEDEDALIDTIVATVEENYLGDLRERGANPAVDIEIRTSRDHPDPWGQPNVSRVVVGGTREELGGFSVGIAPSIDPGNFDQEETAVVMLDQLSAPAGSGLVTINDFILPDTDVVAAVGSIVGFVTSHEFAHTFGDWHTQPNNGVVSIMDTFDVTQAGVGPDGIFGTGDDDDVDFVEDAFDPAEGIRGTEDTLNRIAFALSPGTEGLPDAPSDVTAVVSDRSVRVRWTASEDDTVTGYVARAVRGDAVVATVEVPADETRARFRRLPAGTYTFTVAAVNDAGEGTPASSAPLTVDG